MPELHENEEYQRVVDKIAKTIHIDWPQDKYITSVAGNDILEHHDTIEYCVREYFTYVCLGAPGKDGAQKLLEEKIYELKALYEQKGLPSQEAIALGKIAKSNIETLLDTAFEKFKLHFPFKNAPNKKTFQELVERRLDQETKMHPFSPN